MNSNCAFQSCFSRNVVFLLYSSIIHSFQLMRTVASFPNFLLLIWMYASPLYTVEMTSFKFEVVFWVVMLPLKATYRVVRSEKGEAGRYFKRIIGLHWYQLAGSSKNCQVFITVCWKSMVPFIKQVGSKNKVFYSIVIFIDMTRKVVHVLFWCANQFHSDRSGHILVLCISRDNQNFRVLLSETAK